MDMYLRREKEKKGKQITIYHDLKIDIEIWQEK
jgi:hypothetical protein